MNILALLKFIFFVCYLLFVICCFIMARRHSSRKTKISLTPAAIMKLARAGTHKKTRKSRKSRKSRKTRHHRR